MGSSWGRGGHVLELDTGGDYTAYECPKCPQSHLNLKKKQKKQTQNQACQLISSSIQILQANKREDPSELAGFPGSREPLRSH